MRRRRRDRTGRVSPASDLVRAILEKRGIKREVREQRLLTHWREVVGDRIAERSFPDGLDRGLLWVRVASSTWLHQLSFLRSQIIENANRLVGDPPLVRDVRFHLGPRSGAVADDLLAPVARIRRRPPAERPLPAPATGKRLEAIEREAAGIEDEELRRIIIETRRRLNL